MTEEREFDLWIDGFQEMDSLYTPPQRLGKVRAKSFKEALTKLRDADPNPNYYNVETGSYWCLKVFEVGEHENVVEDMGR